MPKSRKRKDARSRSQRKRDNREVRTGRKRLIVTGNPDSFTEALGFLAGFTAWQQNKLRQLKDEE